MPRKPRIEFEGATYHIMARGNRGADIFLEAKDSLLFLDLLGEIAGEEDWDCFAFCLMPNHYHLLVRTRRATLSKGMQRLNGRYAAHMANTHDIGGHLLQGRFKAILVDEETYLKELIRYIALNPVRAGLAGKPEQWRWGSYRSLVLGTADQAASWFDPKAVDAVAATARSSAETWRQFVEAGMDTDAPRLDLLEEQLAKAAALGSKAYLEGLAARGLKVGKGITPDQEPIAAYAERAVRRGQAMAEAHLKGGHRQADIAKFFGVDNSTVSKAIARYR